MPAYTAITVVAMALAVVVDLAVLRSRLVRTGSFWISLAIMFFFQIFVDGWLTRARDTIVFYAPEHFSGVRVFFHTPLEDFGFGFALILFTLSVWAALTRRAEQRAGQRAGGRAGTGSGRYDTDEDAAGPGAVRRHGGGDGADLGGGAPPAGSRDRVGSAP